MPTKTKKSFKSRKRNSSLRKKSQRIGGRYTGMFRSSSANRMSKNNSNVTMTRVQLPNGKWKVTSRKPTDEECNYCKTLHKKKFKSRYDDKIKLSSKEITQLRNECDANVIPEKCTSVEIKNSPLQNAKKILSNKKKEVQQGFKSGFGLLD